MSSNFLLQLENHPPVPTMTYEVCVRGADLSDSFPTLSSSLTVQQPPWSFCFPFKGHAGSWDTLPPYLDMIDFLIIQSSFKIAS